MAGGELTGKGLKPELPSFLLIALGASFLLGLKQCSFAQRALGAKLSDIVRKGNGKASNAVSQKCELLNSKKKVMDLITCKWVLMNCLVGRS